MKKLLIAAAVVAMGGSAQAADLAVKSAPYVKAPAPLPVYDWTGFYIGINAGDGFGRSYTQLGGVTPGGNAQSRLGGLGGVGGGQIGYNWQYGSFLGLGNVVFGVETDIQGAGFDDNRTCEYDCNFALHQKLDWFGTARARVGLATGPVLTYFTGGFAYGGVNTSLTVPGGLTNSFNNTKTGYALGSGVEAALGGNWTGRIEYMYLNLGTQDGAFFGTFPYRSEVTEQIFRVGLNYRMGEHAMYVAEPLANWNGFYLGGNLGGAYSLNRSSLANTGYIDQFNMSSTTGFMGGGQIGWNWQASAWVFGVEADFQASAQKDNKVCELTCSPTVFAAFNQKMDWLGTARVRAGYSLGRTLFYATGGFAYGDVKTSVSSPQIASTEFDHKLSGYAVGGGIESPFTFLGLFGPGWTAKTEYLYVDLGKASDLDTASGFTFTTHVQEQILRTGLNYHFNQPVVARY